MNSRMIFNYVFLSALLVHISTSAYGAKIPKVNADDHVVPAECYVNANGRAYHQAAIDGARTRDAKALLDTLDTDKSFAFKTINLKWTQTQDTDTSPIKLDASSSTVPSGQIDYTWNANQKGPIITLPDGSSGSARSITLTITDKVCGFSESTGLKIFSK